MDIYTLASFIESLDEFLWESVGVPLLVVLGLVLCWQSNFFQLRRMPNVLRNFWQLLRMKDDEQVGVHPVRTFFASVGGCIGIGNIVGVCAAVQMGGPGALFWIWVTALLGMLIKYSEIYLGIRYRQANDAGGYDGGPMFFLRKAFKGNWIPKLVCLLLCVYGVEVYMFGVVSSSLAQNFFIDKRLVVGFLFVAVMLAVGGGVDRVGAVCSAVIPLFMALFMGMSFWVLAQNASAIPGAILDVFRYAFTSHGALGGFVGSALITTVSQGVKRGCYTGDIGVGYASVIHSETSTHVPQKQAALGIFGIILDTFVICTLSVALILVTGRWAEPISPELIIQVVLEDYFPLVGVFMPIFLFLLGYSTMIAYLVVGVKCAQHLSPRYGKAVYVVYASVAFIAFSFVTPSQALSLMSATGALLLIINSVGLYRLRREVVFELE